MKIDNACSIDFPHEMQELEVQLHFTALESTARWERFFCCSAACSLDKLSAGSILGNCPTVRTWGRNRFVSMDCPHSLDRWQTSSVFKFPYPKLSTWIPYSIFFKDDGDDRDGQIRLGSAGNKIALKNLQSLDFFTSSVNSLHQYSRVKSDDIRT